MRTANPAVLQTWSQTSSIGMPWEPVRNTDALALPLTYGIQNSGSEAQQSGDSDAQ